ncbi:MAG TPA: type II toxin-antitoxin system VapC family toxin [Solirubrobacteraceae bacterium]|jgi:predicted nucleic acid-binding protein|nr:type II toxin-antitoxin system VapC family toxin [Solirubrobacteraceae bacterium]
MKDWAANKASLHAPILARYKVANAFTKDLASDALDEAWTVIDELPITYHPLQDTPKVVRIAIALERRSAYDAAYLAHCWRAGASACRRRQRRVSPSPPIGVFEAISG